MPNDGQVHERDNNNTYYRPLAMIRLHPHFNERLVIDRVYVPT